MTAAPDASDGLPLPDERTERDSFWRLRRRVLLATLGQLLTTARLRTILIVVLSVVFWGALFALFYGGFSFVQVSIVGPRNPYQVETIEFIFHLFFASLNVMLVLSAGIILYGGLFSSEETRFLLTLPVRSERIVLFKFHEAVLFSSWGFFLLASPLTISYGVVYGAPWHYYALILPLILSFVYIPCVIGGLACLLLIYRLAHVRVMALGVVALIALFAAGAAVWEVLSLPRGDMFGPEWFHETLRLFSFTRGEWLPSTWLCAALLDASQPVDTTAYMFSESPVIKSLLGLTLLTSNALMGRLLFVAVAKRCMRKAFSQLECRPRKPRRVAIAPIDRFVELLLGPFPQRVRLLLVKDWRLLRRDPVQWSQFLIFFGLLGLYFLNVNRFSYVGKDIERVTWVNMVSFLNLAVVGLILSTFTTRFIYPMISLEGRRFWVLGLLPIGRDTIVWSKFLFASIGSWGPCALLILVSDLMLRVSPLVVGVHQFATVLLCSGLSALAVGLGAAMPDFRETSPSKIAAGFGGTLNLVLSALYIILIVVCTALPCHFYLISQGHSLHWSLLDERYLKAWIVGGTGLSVVLVMLATVLPLQWGVRSFRRLEFY